MLARNQHAFQYGNQPFGCTKDSECTFELNEGAKPVNRPPYRIAPKKREAVKETIEELRTLGIIEPSRSEWAFPVLIIKKGEKMRVVVDLRELNKITKTDSYPIPRIAGKH